MISRILYFENYNKSGVKIHILTKLRKSNFKFQIFFFQMIIYSLINLFYNLFLDFISLYHHNLF